VQQQIAYELHDGIAQLLVSAQQHLETFHDLQQNQAILAQHHLDLGLDRLQRAIGETGSGTCRQGAHTFLTEHAPGSVAGPH